MVEFEFETESKFEFETENKIFHEYQPRSPSIRQIADFLLYLFQEKLLQPSTIDGYRTAIADKVGNTRINISKDENLNRLLDGFHCDKPKRQRGVPSWGISPWYYISSPKLLLNCLGRPL